jgi:hypothetical protein
MLMNFERKFVGFKLKEIVILSGGIVLKFDVIIVNYFERVILLKIIGFREKMRGVRK